MIALLAVALGLTAAPAPGGPAAPTSAAPGGPAAPTSAVEVPRAERQEPLLLVPLVHTGGVILGMRLSLSIIWPDAYNPVPWSRSFSQFKRAYREPPEFRRERSLFESDGDPWPINVVGHGLFGAEVYGRFRQCGSGPIASLLFVTGAAVFWEYGPEAFHKRPSAVDLALTPVWGVLLGEGRVQIQRWLRGRPRGAWRRALEIVIDPLGEAERGWLGTRC